MVAAAAALGELICARRQYPGQIDATEARAIHKALWARIRLTLESPAFQPYKELFKEPEFDDLKADTTARGVVACFLTDHPQFPKFAAIAENDQQTIAVEIEKCMRACHDAADGETRQLALRVTQILVVDCRIPSEADSTEHADMRRHVQMLHQYWSRCRAMVIHASESPIGIAPYPLTPLVENLRARIEAIFPVCDAVSGSEEARRAANLLLDMLVGGDLEDLAGVPEWTCQQVATVDQFLVRAELQLGSSAFSLTRAEELTLKSADEAIDVYKRRVKDEWGRIRARVEAIKATPKKTTPDNSSSPLALGVDVELFTVSYGSHSCAFTKRQDQLFDLIARLANARGGTLTFDALREKGGVWDGSAVEDSTIRSAITRLRKHLSEHGLGTLADAISTGTFRGKAFVQLTLDKLDPKSN